jgi:hypothetical protein
MQCASCHFENLPGMAACGRCGARLDLAKAMIDVHPPRPRPAWKHLRRLIPWYGVVLRTRENAARLGDRVLRLPGSMISTGRGILTDFTSVRESRGVLLRVVVPGWPQIFAGDRARGKILLGIYTGLLGLGALAWGSDLGSTFLLLAAAVHAASVVDAVFNATSGAIARAIGLMLCFAVLGAAYLAIGLGLSWLLGPAVRRLH